MRENTVWFLKTLMICLILLAVSLWFSGCSRYGTIKDFAIDVGQEANDRLMDDSYTVICNNFYSAEIRFVGRHGLGLETFNEFCDRGVWAR